jgi:hypothetical protein
LNALTSAPVDVGVPKWLAGEILVLLAHKTSDSEP